MAYIGAFMLLHPPGQNGCRPQPVQKKEVSYTLATNIQETEYIKVIDKGSAEKANIKKIAKQDRKRREKGEYEARNPKGAKGVKEQKDRLTKAWTRLRLQRKQERKEFKPEPPQINKSNYRKSSCALRSMERRCWSFLTTGAMSRDKKRR
jgi:hypothetical protein